ncbi:family A G protein-coupled receptor-like protein [Conidiobolus coronatus NRRL 28638]|uniref:Family A G protein-coupled receptor-like protein n=1 Tax=Conidiobolus coronatus (strain ATCC 28846 / CBS 209.66 / NRRL 28638) TaxID=796925 RepID=A0A137NSF7_CONC2|nr:family A G protein-coupled receptor-like protein [Conidiobolus coronatus NRRL 28638]|eukprot:KXN65695.1 family A G protein-coupled receptor-like protein [Conidiobolus coronatus NRRL 28638]
MSSATRAPGYTDEMAIFNIANLSVCGTLGVIINSLVLWVLFRKVRKGGAHEDIKICAFVAVTDLLVSIGLLFRAIFSQVPYNILKYHPNWCKFDLLTSGVLLLVSGYSLGVMSWERFILICFNKKLSIYVWFGLIFALWTPQFVLICFSASENLQFFTRIETSCSLLPVRVAYYSFAYALSMFFISFFSVVFCYFCIMITKFRQCLNQLNLNVPKDRVYSEFRSTLVKSIINILLFIGVYAGKMYTGLYEISTEKKRTLLMDFVSQNLLQYSAIVNSLILLYMNVEVRKSFFELLREIKSKVLNK